MVTEVSENDSLYVYNATTGEYFSLGSGWKSAEEALGFSEAEGYIDTDTQDGVIGVEKLQL